MVANVVEFGTRTSIELQAREWLVRMDGDEPLTDAEKMALKEWMSRSAFHAGELTRIARLWKRANVMTELLAGIEAQRRELKRSRGRRKGKTLAARWMWTGLMTAGALLSSVLFVYCGVQQVGGVVTHAYETVVGEQKTVFLADDSSIQLNTNSRVEVAYGGQVRKVRLLRGEALFSVRPDPNRAFEVLAADSIVRAVGTRFDVHLDGRRVDVTVAKGVVDVANVGSTIATTGKRSTEAAPLRAANLGRLSAGEVTHFTSGSGSMQVRRLAEPELRRRMAWQQGYLEFSGEPLSEVVAQLNRYSTTTLAIGDPQLASIAIGGHFRVGDLDAVLELLSTAFGIRASRVDDHTLRLESGLEQ